MSNKLVSVAFEALLHKCYISISSGYVEKDKLASRLTPVIVAIVLKCRRQQLWLYWLVGWLVVGWMPVEDSIPSSKGQNGFPNGGIPFP